jgi:SAM-dependent methyltransferase
MGDWIAFWDSDHTIYVSACHRDVHFRTIAEDIAGYVPSAAATLLDYGCGEALYADRIAAKAQRLVLVEAAPTVRAKLKARFAREGRIEVKGPEELAAVPDHSIDVAIVNSVAQYLTAPQLDELLAGFRRLLRPAGLLLIGDVIPPHISVIGDALALLRFAARHGFVLAAVGGLLVTMVSDYGRLRSRLGLSRYSEAEMMQRLAAGGFSATRAASNIGHNQARMTFLARPLPSALKACGPLEGAQHATASSAASPKSGR